MSVSLSVFQSLFLTVTRVDLLSVVPWLVCYLCHGLSVICDMGWFVILAIGWFVSCIKS